jgi:methionine-gamma-lyase
MYRIQPEHGLSTLVNHAGEGNHPQHAHLSPIYQTSTFNFPDVDTGAEIIHDGPQRGYYYTRIANPNADQLAFKIALLEGLDLVRAHPEAAPQTLIAGRVFASGMASISAVVFGRCRAGDTIIAQRAIYGNAFNFINRIATQLGIQAVWLDDTRPESWQAAFAAHPGCKLAYAETPSNPTLKVVDLRQIAEIAHQHGAWLAVDNTFATPYCQRPLSLGADIIVHSTTKYLSGHGALIGGAVVSRHPDFVATSMQDMLVHLGGVPGPFDCWLAGLGLRTFELRMARHCENAEALSRFLSSQPRVATVYYPGLVTFEGYDIACRQMQRFGGMLSFELKGGYQAGVTLLENVQVASLAVSLGNVDTLIQHPASMTHASVAPDQRQRMGISDGLVRLSVGIENTIDLINDLDQALLKIEA